MSDKFLDIKKPLEENQDNFPNYFSAREMVNGSPFEEGSLFNKEKEVFPLEKKYGKTVHTAQK